MASSIHNKTLEDFNDEVFAMLTLPFVYLYVLLVIGILGNTTIVIIYRNYNKNVYRKIIWMIGVFDLLICIIGIPFNISRMYHYYTFFSELSCQIIVATLEIEMMTSTHLLLLLTVYRFRQVCFPLSSRQITMQNVSYFIVGCFAIGIVLGVPRIAVSQPLAKTELGNNITGLSCSVAWKDSTLAWKNYNTFLTSLFLFYSCMIVLCYVLIGRTLYIQSRKRNKHLHADQTDKASNLSLKMTKIAFTVSIVFTASYLPLFLNEVIGINASKNGNRAFFGLALITQRSYLINHVANVFIYLIFDDRFRYHMKNRILRTVCFCGVTREDTSEDVSTDAD